MELILHLRDHESLTTALKQGVGGVAVPIPESLDSPLWSELADWRAATRKNDVRFYLIWDARLTEADLPQVADKLAAVARLEPDGLQLRDLGLVAETRRREPRLPLIAAANWGAHNSPGVRLAEALGFSRVVLEGPVNLKDLALIGRQTALPLAVALPPACQGYASLCLLAEYLGGACETYCLSRAHNFTPQHLLAALETFSGLCQLGLAAVHLNAGLFAPASLGRVLELFQSVAQASPLERPKVLAAIRQVVEAFGKTLLRPQPPPVILSDPPAPTLAPSRREAAPPEFRNLRRVWLQTRDYAEALVLARQWREPLLLSLTPENYAAFLKDHRRWGPRRLLWRLPPVIRESSLAFYQKALETLAAGGYNRFVAGDWGAVALVGGVGGQIYGDQTLGVRNSLAVKAARAVKVTRICLPPTPQPERRRDLLKAAPPASFWGYLYQMTPLVRCPGPAPGVLPREDLRWISAKGNDTSVLIAKTPLDLRHRGVWLKDQGIFPLVVALAHSSVPLGQLPAWLTPRPRSAPGK
jgi:collagenase-like PrtC family protease